MKEETDWMMIGVYALAALFCCGVLLLLATFLYDYIMNVYGRWKCRRRPSDLYGHPVSQLRIPRQDSFAVYANQCPPVKSSAPVPSEIAEVVCPVDDDKKEEPKEAEDKNDVQDSSVKCFFPLNKGKIILKKYPTDKFQCVYEAEEKKPGRYEFTIISIGKVKAWDISDAVTNVGSVTLEEAKTFVTKQPGVIEQKQEGGTTYWAILEKAKIEFKK